MGFDISVKVRELGELQGVFMGATKNSIYLKDAILKKASSTIISSMKISRKYIISVGRLQAPAFEKFSAKELAVAMKLNNGAYAHNISKVLTEKQTESPVTTDSLNRPSVKKLIKGYELNSCIENISEGVEEDSDQKNKSDKKNISGKKGKKESGEWNQFEANEKLFGIKSKFDMDEYTTPIDTTASDYLKRYEQSNKIANEIVNEKTTDLHRLEERGIFKNNGEQTDEAIYSSVNSTKVWDTKKKQPCTVERPSLMLRT